MHSIETLKLILSRYPHEEQRSISREILRPNSPKGRFLYDLELAFEQIPELDQTFFNEHDSYLLLDYIRQTHIYYLQQRLPELEQSILLLEADLYRNHPLLPLLHRFYKQYSKKLTAHIEDEEVHLLPYLEYLMGLKADRFDHYSYYMKRRDDVLIQFSEHHDDTEDDLRRVRIIMDTYKPSCTNISLFRVLRRQLESLEKDLSVHAYIEDFVLLPRFRGIENELDEAIRVLSLQN